MKHTGNTVTKPATGNAAKVLSEAIKTNGYVASERSWATVNRIAERLKREKQSKSV